MWDKEKKSFQLLKRIISIGKYGYGRFSVSFCKGLQLSSSLVSINGLTVEKKQRPLSTHTVEKRNTDQ